MIYQEKFSKIIKHYFTDFLVKKGFKEYKETHFGRNVNNDFFQFITFGKAKGDEKSILVNFTTYLLFEKKTPMFSKVITLKPGSSIDYFIPNRPDLRWFEYDTQEKLENSIVTIKSILSDYVFKWLDEHYTTDSIFELDRDKRLRVTDDTWRNVDYIFMYLREGRVEKATETAEFVLNKPQELEEIKDLCLEVLETIKSKGFDDEKYLSSIVEENKRNLKIEDWPILYKTGS